MQTVQPSYVLGVDISNNNGHVDMTAWKDNGVRFVYTKASEGATFKDGLMIENITKAKSAELPIGVYHFVRPSRNSVAAEANNFIAQLKKAPTELLPVLDVEDTNYVGTASALIAWVKEFVNQVHAATGKTCMIYTGKWYADRFGGFSELSTFKLWTAYYPATRTETTAPESYGGWTSYTAWQYTEKGTLPGVAGNIDMNYAVSLEALGYAPLTLVQANYIIGECQRLYPLFESCLSTQKAFNYVANKMREMHNVPLGQSLGSPELHGSEQAINEFQYLWANTDNNGMRTALNYSCNLLRDLHNIPHQ
jgi:GH25 family lysozyme M1 (1,4-beta-N-acetylmuramidase)